MTEYQLDSDEGRRWFPRIGEMFQDGRDVPPTLAANLAVTLASGEFDALTGRVFSVGDDMDGIKARMADILEKDLHTLRMAR
jgi:hypothetical protein